MQFSDKQSYTALLGTRDSRFIMISGPTRSGKSESAIAGFMQFAGRTFTGCDFGLIAKSQLQLDAVVLPKVRAWCARVGIEATSHDKNLSIASYHGEPNKFWYIIGRDGAEQAAKRVQGLGLAGAYVDEFPRMPSDLIDMLTSRMLEYEQAKLVASMNPEGPDHWAKVDWIDEIVAGKRNGEYIQFAMTDNPILSPIAIAEIGETYTGAFYRRMILGEWAASTGLVHPTVQYKTMPDEREALRWEVALDYGAATVTHAVLVGYFKDGWYVADEWRHDGAKSGQMPHTEQVEKLYAWATNAGGRSIASWAVPQDAIAMLEGIAEHASGGVYLAIDPVLWGVQQLNRRLENRLFIDPKCKALRKEIASYKWKEDPATRGDDIPDKASANGAHGCDALRYWAATATVAETGKAP